MTNHNIWYLIGIWALPVLFGITAHEVAHGWVASKLGDKTALLLGRITLNPLRHIDPVGTIIVPGILLYFGGFIFGWAKPVPVEWRNLRQPRRDMPLVAVAGPLANLLMAFLWGAVNKLGTVILLYYPAAGVVLRQMGEAGILINAMLLFLNILPIPPLDGSRVVSSLLPPRLAMQFNRLEPFGFFILLFLIFLGLLQWVLIPPVLYLHASLLQFFNSLPPY